MPAGLACILLSFSFGLEEQLLLRGNNFTGDLPESLGAMTRLGESSRGQSPAS